MKPSKTTTPAPIKHRTPNYSTFLPFLLVLLTLTFTSVREVLSLLERRTALQLEIHQAAEPLVEASKQAAFIMSLRQDLEKLAETDPVAARVLADVFPPSVKASTDLELKPVDSATP